MMRMSTRLLAPAVVLAASICTTTQTAVAAVEPVPDQPPIVLGAGEGCAFPLRVDGADGNRHTKTFTDRNGRTVRVITAGKGEVLTYTNLATGESVTIKTGGSVQRTVTNPDGTLTVTATGGNGLILFPTDVP